MCSVFTHPLVPIALSVFLPQDTVSTPLLLTGAACAVIPDLDVLGFPFGIRYDAMLGHRGLSHSLLFALALSTLLTVTLCRSSPGSRWSIFLFLFGATLSHPLLDMLTNGGLGVALWAPFSPRRYFFPWRPIEVSPLGIGRFFSARGARVILSEVRWVWLPAAGVVALGTLMRRWG